MAVTSSSSSSSETGQACAVGAGAFHPYLGHLPEGAHPLEHRFIAPGGGVERLHTEDTADRIQGGSHVDIQVGVDSTDDGAASFYDRHGHPFFLFSSGVARPSREGVTVISTLFEQGGPSPLWNGARRFYGPRSRPTRQRDPAAGKSGQNPGVFDGSEDQPLSGGSPPDEPLSS